MNLRLLSIVGLIVLLTGCAVATPFVAGGAAGHAIGRYEENLKVRAAAALEDEPDLLTYSVQAIARGNTEEAAKVYLSGYNHPEYSPVMKSLALYQTALLYMNRFNRDRDYNKATEYFEEHHEKYPQSRLYERVEDRLKELRRRQASSINLNADELLKSVDRVKLLAQPQYSFDEELTPLSERAITESRSKDAEGVYLAVYSNQASSSNMRAKSLYQIGLIYMSPYNQEGNNTKALQYFRKITEEFPEAPVSKRAHFRINEVINRQ